MTRARCSWLACAVTIAVLTASAAFGQTPPPAGGGQGAAPPRGQRAGPGRAGRAALPPITPNMTQQALQTYMDAWAIMQARTALQLTEEQFPVFVVRLNRVQEIRRRHVVVRRRLMNELSALLQPTTAPTTARDEGIDARLRALTDAADGVATELRKAYQDLDAVLTPWQRGRFRQFEDQLERKKIELLTKIGGGG